MYTHSEALSYLCTYTQSCITLQMNIQWCIASLYTYIKRRIAHFVHTLRGVQLTLCTHSEAYISHRHIDDVHGLFCCLDLLLSQADFCSTWFGLFSVVQLHYQSQADCCSTWFVVCCVIRLLAVLHDLLCCLLVTDIISLRLIVFVYGLVCCLMFHRADFCPTWFGLLYIVH